MYPHVTQFETRDAELRDRLRLEAERRAAAPRRSTRAPADGRPVTRLRALVAALLRTA
jgi:hypothetical protein